MEKVVYKIGSFVDFAGLTRQVVFAAVTVNKDAIIVDEDNEDEHEFDFSEKHLALGVSVQNPSDIKVNTELGKTIALGKAKKDRSCIGKIYATNKGMINQPMVEALLEQELKYFQSNPGVYLKGYNKDKELFQKNAQAYLNKYKIDLSRLATTVVEKAITDAIENVNNEYNF